jgi:hypothetical protein
LSIKEVNLNLISANEVFQHLAKSHELGYFDFTNELEAKQHEFSDAAEVLSWIQETVEMYPDTLCVLDYHGFHTPHSEAILNYALNCRGIYKGKILQGINMNLHLNGIIVCVTIRENSNDKMEIKKLPFMFENFLKNTTDSNCIICFEPTRNRDPAPTTCGKEILFFCCNHCLKHVCTVCYPQMSSQKCPVCRTGRVVSNNGLAPVNEIKRKRFPFFC